MAEYIDTRINPADYIEVWECEDIDHGKQLVMAVNDLQYLPPADVRPVVRGKWIEEDSAGRGIAYHCSVCGKGGRLSKFNFCSDCGAYMKGENDG